MVTPHTQPLSKRVHPLRGQSRIRAVLCGVALVVLAPELATVARAASSAPLINPRVTRTEGPTNIVYGFFHPDSGERVARLQIGKITRDYGKQGVFRVAWKARPVLNDFELRVTDASAWPAVASQLADLLREFSTIGGLVINGVSLELGPTEPRITAPSASFGADGELILPAARVGEDENRRVVLPLRGARAGFAEIFPPDPTLQLAPR